MKIGREIQSPEWEKVKETFTEDILSKKMEQVEVLKNALIESGEATLKENTAHDLGAYGHYGIKGKKNGQNSDEIEKRY